MISIHAPLTGSDKSISAPPATQGNFNPRSPYGERPGPIPGPRRGPAFQSTLPLRGATSADRSNKTSSRDFNPRSPYGERPIFIAILYCHFNFNPRSPYGERPSADRNIIIFSGISIHAPLTGSDTIKRPIPMAPGISIHAPLTGSDSGPQWRSEQLKDFNPRSPYGERPKAGDMDKDAAVFQSTLPLRGAT